MDLQQAWDRASAAYLELRAEHGSHISYGPFAPGEDELALLGPLDGLSVLDLGCGGGQNAVRFAQHGAAVIGLDFSPRQIDIARETARRHGVDAAFVLDRAETLSQVADASVDLVFSAGVFPYITDIGACLSHCRRVLRPAGRLVFSLDHPVRGCFYDAETQELTGYPDRSYFDARPRTWTLADSGAIMRTVERSVSAWVDLLLDAGFQVRRLLEPQAPLELLDELFPSDGALAALRNIPHTIIVAAELRTAAP